jgi:uncharacterized protein
MAVQTSYPGVYIEEFTPGAPIQGVSTNIAAFIGVTARGDFDTPTRITSWDAFRREFGEQPVPGYMIWFAVRGFFENGGQVCYIVRASNGDYDRWTLDNGNGDPLINVRARLPGATGIVLTVNAASLITNAEVYQPTGAANTVSGNEITLGATQGRQFRPGDSLELAGLAEARMVMRVTGDILMLDETVPIAAPFNVRLRDVTTLTRTIRIEPAVAPFPPNVLVRGTMLTFDATAQAGGTIATGIVDSVQTEYIDTAPIPPVVTYRVTLRDPLGIPIGLDPAAGVVTVESVEFDLDVAQAASTWTYANLSVDPAHPRYYRNIINTDDTGVVRAEAVEPPPVAAPPDTVPVTATVDTVGAAETLPLGDGDFIQALDTLRRIDEVSLVACPDRTTAAVQTAIIDHCQQLADRFAILDSAPDRTLSGANSIENQRNGVDSARGYAALYYPWLRVQNANRDATMLVPPSGHVCGIIARSDNTRGVHKAPANEIVSGALGVQQTMSDVEQGLLNLRGINVIRVFVEGGRPVLWGARTTATDTNWQYVSTRRLFLYLEESIQEGIRWAVFEVNNLGLWQKLRRSINEFLLRAYRDGALFGETAEDAFYVRIDETLNPFSEQALGRLHIEIGVRPSFPAEFIIVRIGIWPGGSEVTEA